MLNKYQFQNEGNVASQGFIQPCFIKGSRFFFFLHPAASVVTEDEEGTYILMRGAGFEASTKKKKQHAGWLSSGRADHIEA